MSWQREIVTGKRGRPKFAHPEPPLLTETQIQRAVFQHLRQRGADNVFAFHVPNGGYRRPTEAAIFKGLGQVNGVPDVIIIHRGICYALELKTCSGKLSREQTDTLIEMRRCGCDTGYAHGLDAALAWLEERGILRGHAS
jgi:hypothetical protein